MTETYLPLLSHVVLIFAVGVTIAALAVIAMSVAYVRNPSNPNASATLQPGVFLWPTAWWVLWATIQVFAK